MRKNAINTRGKPFKSGNSGRPKGARNKATVAAEALLDGEAELLTRVCINKALEGNMAALRLCMERILPPQKSRPVSIQIPKIDGPRTILSSMQAVVHSVADGITAPEDGQAVMALLELTRRAQEHVDIEGRLAVLEEKMG
jgi:hypothetical protein